MAFSQEPRVQQNYSIPVAGDTLGFNTVSTSGAQVIGQDGQRKTIVFGNPGATNTVFVYQMLDLNGNALAPTNASPGGAWPVLPGAIATFTGGVQGAWGAFAANSSTNAISIMSSWS